MAFLGSIGKSLGLDSSFGQGLVEGLATSVDKGIQSDMKRTQDNIDDLSKVAFQSGLAEKKRFEKELKENREIVEEIAANMGGSQGIKAPLAPVAAQSLITQLGINQALAQSRGYKKNFINYGEDPIKELELNTKINGEGPTFTISDLAKSTVSPISNLDMSQLGDSANVGFMKANFFGGAQDSSKEIETRSSALLKAAGVDVESSLASKLPAAIQVKLDPLILGMQDNPKAEEVRLVTMLKNTDRESNPELYTRIKNKIDLTRDIMQAVNPKKGLSQGETNSARNEFVQIVAQNYKLATSSGGPVGNPFVKFNVQNEKNLLALESVNYYMSEYQKSRINSGRDDIQNNYQIIMEAATKGLKVSGTMINGIYTVGVTETPFYSSVQQSQLAVGNKKDGAAVTSTGNGVKTVTEVRKENKTGANNPETTINELLPQFINTEADSRERTAIRTRLLDAIEEQYNISDFSKQMAKLKELESNIKQNTTS
tara:strand:+ start:196 stop:1653 length:1458 start_codon:yes stop_codon:yes gene_type:complete